MKGLEYSFEKLNLWQEAKLLVVDVYHLLDGFPKFEKYALCDQIRRAIVSVPSNIAEGSGRKSLREQIHFLEILQHLSEFQNEYHYIQDSVSREVPRSLHFEADGLQ